MWVVPKMYRKNSPYVRVWNEYNFPMFFCDCLAVLLIEEPKWYQ